MTAATSTEQFLSALYADAPAGSLVEVRSRSREGMRRTFFDTDALGTAGAMINQRSATTDVYVGIIPRRRHGGSRNDLVERASVLWVDCDTSDSVATLRSFAPSPSIVVLTSTDHLHSYWLLSATEDVVTIEHANRRLARTIGADIACTDGARIARPPSTLNWKHDPPMPVRLERCTPCSRHALTDVVGRLADPPTVPAHTRRRALHDQAHLVSDPLLAIDPATYVERLTGARIPRSGKIACPFHHPDRTPSLHVYHEPERGWYCYGCRRGGSVYDFAAYWWLTGQSGRGGLRGDQFTAVRDRLQALFFGAPGRE